MDNPIVSTSNLVKSFGSSVALNGLDLKIPKGISGFIGKNGAGKTTTIGVLIGLLKPSNGEATIFGLDCWNDSFEIRSKIGILHEVNLYPGGFTGERFLEHVAQMYKVTQPHQKSKECLKAVGLTNSDSQKKIKGFSAGMLRRLGLAQALIGDPELVILDEPTANIDPLGRIELLNLIKGIRKEKDTHFLICTHILSDLEKICDWLSIIDKGKITEQGRVKELAGKYSANVYRIEVSNPEILVRNISGMPFVEKSWVEDQKVFCKVNDTDMFYTKLPRIIADLDLQLRSFQSTFSTIEEIYANVTGEKSQ